MSHTVAIIEPALAFRRGLGDALTRSGYAVTDIVDEATAVIVTLRDDESCSLIGSQVDAGTVVLALLPEPSAAAHAHAIFHGVAGIADWCGAPEQIAAALDDAIAGWMRLPAAVTRVLAAEWPDSHAPRPEVSGEEAGWLTRLAAGDTVTRIADETGYSERAMFRRLHDLYSRLGAANRAEAIVAAERLGLLGDPVRPADGALY